jgi:hypothetical protein
MPAQTDGPELEAGLEELSAENAEALANLL